MFRFYLKKLLRCPATYIGALLIAASMIYSVAGELEVCMPLYLFQCAMYVGILPFFLPIASVLPVCYIRHALRKNAAFQFPLLHSSPVRYSLGGLAASAISGAFVSLLGLAVFTLFILIALPGPVDVRTALFTESNPLYQGMSGPAIFLVEALILAANCAMFPCIAYAVSAFSANQYVCATAPFALWMLLMALMQSLYQLKQAKVFLILDPAQAQLGGLMSSSEDGGLIYLCIYVFCVITICGGVFLTRLKKRLKNG